MELLRSNKEIECYCALLHVKRWYIGPYSEGLYNYYKQNNFINALNVLTILFPSLLLPLTYEEVSGKWFSKDMLLALDELQRTYKPRPKRVASVERYNITRKIKSTSLLVDKMNIVLLYYYGSLHSDEHFIPLDVEKFSDDIPIHDLICSIHDTHRIIPTYNKAWE